MGTQWDESQVVDGVFDIGSQLLLGGFRFKHVNTVAFGHVVGGGHLALRPRAGATSPRAAPSLGKEQLVMLTYSMVMANTGQSLHAAGV